ncbi:plasmid pRiA4b ORF-3 family protein, partial [Rhizobium leguminosarum]|uniref:plasmid pRiA4b ORF-3 family protein n=2 Tax=Rhizobium/Agrobacterium group TaxID=227290 RepID=UPI001C94B49B
GDGWTHSIKIERTFPIVALADPMLIEATGRCPPEDVGGPWGYQEFREALADPAHERHAELTEWWGAKDFDPNNAAFADLNRAVENLAAKWARRSRRKN